MLNVLRSGSGVSTVVRSTHVYTAILLIGLIGRTFPEAFTQRATTAFDVSVEFGSIRANLNPESSSIHESIVSFVLKFDHVHIHIFVPSSKICEEYSQFHHVPNLAT